MKLTLHALDKNHAHIVNQVYSKLSEKQCKDHSTENLRFYVAVLIPPSVKRRRTITARFNLSDFSETVNLNCI